jgi:hypothetical protein
MMCHAQRYDGLPCGWRPLVKAGLYDCP